MSMTAQQKRKLETELNKLFNLPQFLDLLPRSPNMRYWKKGNYAYCWTTEKDIHGKFYVAKYRILKDKSWKLKRKIAFGRRKVAKARARKWFEEA